MSEKKNGAVCTLLGRWDLREISTPVKGGWQTVQILEEREHIWIFGQDETMSSVMDGRIYYHASYWYGENSKMLNLDGRRNDNENNRYLQRTERSRKFFNGPDELFLYDTGHAG